MNEMFFCITAEHVGTGEFFPAEIGYWAVRGSFAVLVTKSRAVADLYWASIAQGYGYTYN
jgi:hypothetical protein